MGWKDLYTYLLGNGFSVYSLGQHQGKCAEPYLVLRANGETRMQGKEFPLYELLAYCPQDQYSEFEGFIQTIKARMKALFPALKLIDGPTAHYLDPDVSAYMTSLTYQSTKKSTINRL